MCSLYLLPHKSMAYLGRPYSVCGFGSEHTATADQSWSRRKSTGLRDPVVCQVLALPARPKGASGPPCLHHAFCKMKALGQTTL